MTTRAYHSAVRARKRAETRARIIEAARDCFLEQGFTRTSVAAIARHAGVSSQTVHAHVGTKGALVGALLQQLESDAGAAQWRDRVHEATDGRARLQAWAGWTVCMLTPARSLKDISREAAADPLMLDLKAQGDAHRRQSLTRLIEAMHDRDELRGDLVLHQAVDQAWILTGLEIYLSCIDCGWSDDAIRDWLADTLAAALLPR